MADIDLERKKSGPAVWPWVAALVALALVVWGVTEAVDTDGEVADVEVVEPVAPATTPEAVATGPLTIGDILGAPDRYVGEPFPATEVEVAEVPTDRGFWITDEGQRLFVVIVDQPQEEPKDINAGQTLRIEQGTLREATFLPEIPGVPLDADTESIAQEQDIFLVVDERYINVLQGGGGAP